MYKNIITDVCESTSLNRQREKGKKKKKKKRPRFNNSDLVPVRDSFIYSLAGDHVGKSCKKS